MIQIILTILTIAAHGIKMLMDLTHITSFIIFCLAIRILLTYIQNIIYSVRYTKTGSMQQSTLHWFLYPTMLLT